MNAASACVMHSSLCRRFAAWLVLSLLAATSLHASEPKWIRIDSSHLSVLTNAEEKRGREVAVRFEQMRGVFGQLLMKSRLNWSKPIEIIAVRSNEDFLRLAPTRLDASIARGGFLLAASDPAFVVLDLSREDSWRAVTGSFARLLLTYNYPPTQDWFDEGFADYFSSLQLDAKTMQIGGDPEAPVAPHPEPGRPAAPPNAGSSFVQVLNGSTWMSFPDLFNAHDSKPATLFRAESWIIMHYLISKNKLPETGTYFGLVELEKAPIEDAIQKAYGMSSAQFEEAVKDYFHTLAGQLQATTATKPAPANSNPIPAPVLADDVGTSLHEIPDNVARSLIAEVSLRVPEHQDQALKDLQAIMADPKTDNPVAHRAMGWYHMEKSQFEEANDELDQASSADLKDPWARYYSAQVKYRESEVTGHGFKGLANMMQDLHAVLDWDPEFAQAYAMLARAQVEGGGLHAAMDSVRAAIQLAPRNQGYVLQMAEVYMASKNFDAAKNLLERLTTSSDSQVASTAKTYLHDLPILRKYGIPPQHDTEQAAAVKSAPIPPRDSQPPTVNPNKPEMPEEAEGEVPAEKPMDKRPIQFLKGTLVNVDCSHPPVATLTISAGARTVKLKTADYKSLTLIGADKFSCDWNHRTISANYKAIGKTEGDLVSLEVQ